VSVKDSYSLRAVGAENPAIVIADETSDPVTPTTLEIENVQFVWSIKEGGGDETRSPDIYIEKLIPALR
jgi:hypothetical protein